MRCEEGVDRLAELQYVTESLGRGSGRTREACCKAILLSVLLAARIRKYLAT